MLGLGGFISPLQVLLPADTKERGNVRSFTLSRLLQLSWLS